MDPPPKTQALGTAGASYPEPPRSRCPLPFRTRHVPRDSRVIRCCAPAKPPPHHRQPSFRDQEASLKRSENEPLLSLALRAGRPRAGLPGLLAGQPILEALRKGHNYLAEGETSKGRPHMCLFRTRIDRPAPAHPHCEPASYPAGIVDSLVAPALVGYWKTPALCFRSSVCDLPRMALLRRGLAWAMAGLGLSIPAGIPRSAPLTRFRPAQHGRAVAVHTPRAENRGLNLTTALLCEALLSVSSA